jgi:hypothetical protein
VNASKIQEVRSSLQDGWKVEERAADAIGEAHGFTAFTDAAREAEVTEKYPAGNRRVTIAFFV